MEEGRRLSTEVFVAPEVAWEVLMQVEHKNYRCRTCSLVDGYLAEETTCRTCGTPLNLTDFV